jgi:hypothetical protein
MVSIPPVQDLTIAAALLDFDAFSVCPVTLLPHKLCFMLALSATFNDKFP